MQCAFCGEQTENPMYCSRSCAAKRNNSVMPKRKRKIYYCSNCNKETGYRRKYCNDCLNVYQLTIADFDNLSTYHKNAKIRGYSKQVYKASGKPYICFNCGYSHHVEVCHIKPVASFDKSAMMSEVNHLENLVALCPNCHWELDNGLLDLNNVTVAQ